MRITDANLPTEVDITPYLPQPVIHKIQNPNISTAQVRCLFVCNNKKCDELFQPEENQQFPRCPTCGQKAALAKMKQKKGCIVIIEMDGEDVEHYVSFDVILQLPQFKNTEPTWDDIENYFLMMQNCQFDVDEQNNIVEIFTDVAEVVVHDDPVDDIMQQVNETEQGEGAVTTGNTD